MNEVAFELDRVTYRYRAVAALDEVTLSIPAGRRLALLGANGCGKSTLLRVLDGLYFPASGVITHRGAPMGEQEFLHDEFALAFRRNVGLLFQNPDVQLFCPTVFDEIAFGPLQLGLSKEQVRAAVEKALDVFEVRHLKDRAPHHLSGGEKKRVAIAAVLVMDPTVLLLDEPTSALDPRSQARIVEYLQRWHGHGRTTVVATHDLHLLSELADDCVVLERGRVLASGSPREILDNEELLLRANLIHPRYVRQ